MKVCNIKNLEKFFETLDKCEGKVLLMGPDLALNLKSKLAQYFSLAQIFSSGEVVKELELVCENPEDAMKLMQYMING